MFVVGVDVGGTTVKLGIFDLKGKIIKKWEIPTDKSECGKNIFPDIAKTIKENIESSKLDINACKGVGLGLPGAVDKYGCVEVCVNLGLKNIYPAKVLSDLLDGIDVKISNDANVAALGEAWKGAAAEYCYENVVMITLGTGVGGGIVIDNKLLNGLNGLAGEIGHLHVRYDETKRCNCGDCGCLEQIASATGIRNEALKALNNTDRESTMRQFGDKLSAKNVFDMAKQGDKLACEVLETVYDYLGLVVSHLAKILDPEAFVIGGGVSKAGEVLVDGIYKYYDKYTALTTKRAKILIATLGNDAGIYGAAKLVMG